MIVAHYIIVSLFRCHTCRLPPPWSVEKLDAYFVVKARSGQKLVYVYPEDDAPPLSGEYPPSMLAL
jgi:hypothetical protein